MKKIDFTPIFTVNEVIFAYNCDFGLIPVWFLEFRSILYSQFRIYPNTGTQNSNNLNEYKFTPKQIAHAYSVKPGHTQTIREKLKPAMSAPQITGQGQ